jgi:hypothetical protein
LTNHNREEPFVLSDRPTQQQLALQFDFGDVVDELSIVAELQSQQSDSANTKQPSLGSFQNDLMEKIVDTVNMMKAWTNVRRNAGAPGPDEIMVDEFPEWLTPRWSDIRQQLLEGTYRPAAARRKSIPKPDGSQRQLGIRRLWELHALQPRLGLFHQQEDQIPYDYEDLFALIAPRPCFVWAPTRDREADAEDLAGCRQRAIASWSTNSLSDRLEWQTPDDITRFQKAQQLAYLRWLKGSTAE